MPLPKPAEIEDAIGRIALTPDGRLLYRYLQLKLMDLSPTHLGALPMHEGRRSLAHDIKSLMDRELSKAGPERDRSGTHDPDQPAVIEPGRPISTGSPRGAGRRVADYADDSKPA